MYTQKYQSCSITVDYAWKTNNILPKQNNLVGHHLNYFKRLIHSLLNQFFGETMNNWHTRVLCGSQSYTLHADVLQLTRAIVMASSAKKKYNYDSKVGLLVIISLLKLMTRPKSLYENRRSVVNIFLLLLQLDQRGVWSFWHFSAHTFSTLIGLLLTL